MRKGRLKRYVPIYEEGASDNDLLVEGARNLRDYFQNSGYPDVEVTFRKTPIENDIETIEFVIDRGTRKKLAQVAFEGNQFFKTETLRERTFLEPTSFRFWHGRYSEGFRKRDEEAIASLYQANGFRDVKVTSSVEDDYKGKANHIAVTYHVKEGPMWSVGSFQLKGLDEGERDPLMQQFSSGADQPFAFLNVDTDRNLVLRRLYQLGFPNATFKYVASASNEPQKVDLTYTVEKGPPGIRARCQDSGSYSDSHAFNRQEYRAASGRPAFAGCCKRHATKTGGPGRVREGRWHHSESKRGCTR